MAGLYAHPSFVATGAILTPPNVSRRKDSEKEKGENGSTSGDSALTTTISNSSHISMNSGSSGLIFNGQTPNFCATEDPHPGTLVTTLDSPLGSPIATTMINRKTSVFSACSTSKLSSAPFRYVNGRRYHSDESIIYPLPCDIPELNRQNLKHHLYKEVFGSWHMADFSDRIPNKVLDIGCGTGIWIGSMHDEFAARGRDDVKFVGIDIVPVHAPMPGVDFTFVRHDATKLPLPFKDDEFDYVFVRDLTLAVPDAAIQSDIVTEVLRILKEGGIIEIQCTDHSIRSIMETKSPRNPSSAYTITPTTQFEAQPKNTHIQIFNSRLRKILGKRNLSPTPCTLVGATFLMEGNLTNNHPVRYALPLDECWWESNTSDGSSAERGEPESGMMRMNSGNARSALNQHPLSEEDKAVRYMARLQLKQFIDSLDHLLAEARDLPGEDFSKPYKEMTNNFFHEGGLRNGECLEFGAWWGTKKTAP